MASIPASVWVCFSRFISISGEHKFCVDVIIDCALNICLNIHLTFSLIFFAIFLSLYRCLFHMRAILLKIIEIGFFLFFFRLTSIPKAFILLPLSTVISMLFIECTQHLCFTYDLCLLCQIVWLERRVSVRTNRIYDKRKESTIFICFRNWSCV